MSSMPWQHQVLTSCWERKKGTLLWARSPSAQRRVPRFLESRPRGGDSSGLCFDRGWPDPWTSWSTQRWRFYLQNAKATEKTLGSTQANQVRNESPSLYQDVVVSRCIDAFLISSSEDWSCLLGLTPLSIITRTWCIFAYLPLWQGDSYCSVPQSQYLCPVLWHWL